MCYFGIVDKAADKVNMLNCSFICTASELGIVPSNFHYIESYQQYRSSKCLNLYNVHKERRTHCRLENYWSNL